MVKVRVEGTVKAGKRALRGMTAVWKGVEGTVKERYGH